MANVKKFSNIKDEVLFNSKEVIIKKVQVQNNETGELYDEKIEIHTYDDVYIPGVGRVPAMTPKRFTASAFAELQKVLKA